MNTMALNLARKWRSKNFDQIVGQDLSVKILKNSLYKNQLFPVYLFSGQHGCGKTTTARVFATALNCQALKNFQHDPQGVTIPCLTCRSCLAMAQQNHPDFIEIDGASNTGVDNVRNIIDAATLLPVMGSYKVYLIDEAHMLSKSAFNAFLKLLEEPPSSVVFMLATTDSQKILKTVTSRCFQLFFDPVSPSVMEQHLKHVCSQEAIAYKGSALSLIAHESSGSLRDALNILEQARFSTGLLTPDAVKQVLGHIDEQELLDLIHRVLTGDASGLLALCKQMNLSRKSVAFLWHKTASFIRALLWQKHGVSSDAYSLYDKQLISMSRMVTTEILHELLEKLYSNELLFTKTVAQYELFEMILLQMASLCSTPSNSSDAPPSAITATSIIEEESLQEDDEQEPQEEDEEPQDIEELQSVWKSFVRCVKEAKEPLLDSICSHVLKAEYNQEKQILFLTFAKEHAFFVPLLDQCSTVWKPLLIQASQTSAATLEIVVSEHSSAPSSLPLFLEPKTEKLDFSNTQQWPKTNLVLHYFSGTVQEIQGA